jgi:hypothetical protein
MAGRCFYRRRTVNGYLMNVVIVLSAVWVALTVLDFALSGIGVWIWGWDYWKSFRWGLTMLAVPVVLMVWGMVVERNVCRVKYVDVALVGLPEGFDGYRIVHLSDIHSMSFAGREKVLRKMVERANREEGDLVVFTGDVVTKQPEELEITGGELRRLKGKDGVMAVAGNHDYCVYFDKGKRYGPLKGGFERVCRGMEDLGWRVLRNENEMIERGGDTLAVVGTENISNVRLFCSTGNLSKAQEGAEGRCKVLLSHDPSVWDDKVVGQSDIGLTLSGHTHAAQLSLLGWSPSCLMHKRSRGLYREGGQYLYVNSGLGETMLPFRIGVAPEITVITLKRKK